MARAPHRLSLFSQALDRVAFLLYFLGAVVPFGALAWLADRYVLPQLPPGPWAVGGIAGLISLGGLSLAAFFALRRATQATIAKLDADKARLEALLEAARMLADARFADDVHRAAARCAAKVTGAKAAFVVAAAKAEGAPQLIARSCEEAVTVYEPIQERFDEVLAPVLAGGVFTVCNDAASGAAIAAVPLPDVNGELPSTALAVVQPGGSFDDSHLGLLSTIAAQVSVARTNADLRDAQRNFFVHVTEILLAALDSHVEEKSGHARRVAQITVLLGRSLGLGEAQLERLHFAALLHDVGMLKLEQSHTGQAAYKAHTTLGQRMLSRIRLWEDLAPMVLHHHEWWDGKGYPEGLCGEAIPIEARLIGLAEAFDSMLSTTSYHKARSFEEALQEIRAGRGTQFDPKIADLFLDLVERGTIEKPAS